MNAAATSGLRGMLVVINKKAGSRKNHELQIKKILPNACFVCKSELFDSNKCQERQMRFQHPHKIYIKAKCPAFHVFLFYFV